MAVVQAGPAVLAEYLASQPSVDLHGLDLPGFRAWLAARIEEQSGSAVFQQKCRIRDIVREHRAILQLRAQAAQQAWDAYAASPQFEALERIARHRERSRRGVEGLTSAVREGRADPQKLDRYEREWDAHRRAYEDLLVACPEKRAADETVAALANLRAEIGLTQEEARLDDLKRQRGRSSSSAGTRFEETAAVAVAEWIAPGFAADGREVVCLRGVTLGAARTEIDFLVVGVTPERPFVEVLAVIEAKRNPNDLVTGFRMRQENLAWLTGDAHGPPPEMYRTGVYLDGRFNRPARHSQDGRDFDFDRSSFDRFRRAPATDGILAGLYFVTTPRELMGVTARETSRILHWVATDPDFDLASDRVMERYRRRALAVVSRVQTRDVLEMYQRARLEQQILFCGDNART